MKRLSLYVMILGLACAGCSDKAPPKAYKPPPVPVQTAAVEKRDFPLYFEAMGTLKPYRTAEVKSQVRGNITKVHFTEGEQVEEGALLYTIDEAPYAIKVQEMQALLAQNQAYLSNAKKKLERYKSLSKQDLISKVEWDELETKVALHEAMIQADEARLAAAKLDLEHCRIRAPLSGRAGKTCLQAGDMADSVLLVTLSQIDRLYVDFDITEKELQRIPATKPLLEIFATGSGEGLAKGEVTFIDHRMDPHTGMLAARGILTTLFKPLCAGQSVRVHLVFGKKEKASMVPLKAIKTNQAGPYVFSVKEDNTVELRSVKLGAEEKGLIVVEEGLEGVDKVITEGHLRLYPGARVEEVR
jgi:membrane fusion protein, multidrug efflux system